MKCVFVYNTVLIYYLLLETACYFVKLMDVCVVDNLLLLIEIIMNREVILKLLLPLWQKLIFQIH